MKIAIWLVAVILVPTSALAVTAPPPTDTPSPPVVCKYVVAAEEGAKPYRMCMTKAQWAAKKVADAKDPNRKVCRYEQASGTRFRSHKICMTAAEWENQRQLERQAIDNLQSKTCVHGGGC